MPCIIYISFSASRLRTSDDMDRERETLTLGAHNYQILIAEAFSAAEILAHLWTILYHIRRRWEREAIRFYLWRSRLRTSDDMDRERETLTLGAHNYQILIAEAFSAAEILAHLWTILYHIRRRWEREAIRFYLWRSSFFFRSYPCL